MLKVNSSDCLTEELVGQASVPYNNMSAAPPCAYFTINASATYIYSRCSSYVRRAHPHAWPYFAPVISPPIVLQELMLCARDKCAYFCRCARANAHLPGSLLAGAQDRTTYYNNLTAECRLSVSTDSYANSTTNFRLRRIFFVNYQ